MEELDKIWDRVLSDAALGHEYGRDKNAWCDFIVLSHRQYAVKRKDKSLRDRKYVCLAYRTG